MSDLISRYEKVKKELAADVKLLAVSKTKPVSMIEELYQAGHRDFGENKVQELAQKSQELEHFADIRWHFIGHLQSNKLNQLLKIKNLYAIHSIDRENLLDKLLTKDLQRDVKVFIQVNTSDEEQKGGFTEIDQVLKSIKKIQQHKNLKANGLMTMGKIRTDNFEQDARSCFSKLANMKSTLQAQLGVELELSMGMSSDFKIAQEFGTNWVRVGSQIFGQRD